jgi:RNA methyltransferase, TrmH family
MITITSQNNKIFRLCIQLDQKKYRDRLGLYIAEGEKLVREAIRAGRAKTVVMREDFVGAFDREDTAFVFMTGSLFSKIAQTETSQGILAIVEEPDFDRASFLKAISANDSKVLVLDRLQDPGNIGTIIRTADAAGYAGMVVMKGSGDIFSPKVIRAAAGSLLRLPVYRADTEEDALSLLSEAGKTIIGTTPENGMDYDKADWSGGIALIIGNEGNGLSETFKAATHRNVKIPMNKEVDSLNAAVAAGILIYESIKERVSSCRIS